MSVVCVMCCVLYYLTILVGLSVFVHCHSQPCNKIHSHMKIPKQFYVKLSPHQCGQWPLGPENNMVHRVLHRFDCNILPTRKISRFNKPTNIYI